LDSFIEQVSAIPNNTYFRLRAVTFDNVPWVVTMKKNDHYVSLPSFLHSFLPIFGRLVSFSFFLLSISHRPDLTQSNSCFCQFPMSQYVKDPSTPLGWRTISYLKSMTRRGIEPDNTNLNADAMVEERDGGGSDVEPDDDCCE
jgi:hypothetical protein